MRVLELGTYIVPAYAGMLLAEQHHSVTKWIGARQDPILDLDRGDELWTWINHGKSIIQRHAREIIDVHPGEYDIIVDNIRAVTWEYWDIDPAREAKRLDVRWVSMRDDVDPAAGRSFDAIAQARAWGDHVGYIPIYIGDTAGGLWLAFKALALQQIGHYVVYQATALAKLVEGELVVTTRRSDADSPPWDTPGTYGRVGDRVEVTYRGELVTEPLRDTAWRLGHLHHDAGRLVV